MNISKKSTALISGLLYFAVIMFLPLKIQAATSACYAQTQPKNGIFYYYSTTCPSNLNTSDGKCYVTDYKSTNPRTFDNGLLCAKDMIDKMLTVQAIPYGCPYGPPGPKAPNSVCPYEQDLFGDLNSSLATLPASSSVGYDEKAASCVNGDEASCNFIEQYINPAIKILSAGVGVVVTLMIVIGGIQYSAAGNDPQKVTSAKKKITNAIIALVLYMLLFAILNWLIPGGIL